MLDLKPYFDAVNMAEAEVQRIASELDVLFREGSEESKAKALEMKPILDQAQKAHAEAVELYQAMQQVNRPNDVAKNFVPVSNESQTEGSQPTVIKRQAYDGLSLVARANFIRSGGTVED
jgi:hypothetical protein